MSAAKSKKPPKSVSALRVDMRRKNQPLRECVSDAMEEYFSVLDGHDCSGLFEMVMREVEVPLLRSVLEHQRLALAIEEIDAAGRCNRRGPDAAQGLEALDVAWKP